MLVRRQDFPEVVSRLQEHELWALDTETTGLRPYHGDRLFSLIIGKSAQVYYFNFQNYAGLDSEWVLPREFLDDLKVVLADPEKKWFLANAKFDLAILAQEGLSIAGQVHDVSAIGRVEYNEHFTYSLDALAMRIGEKKSDAVAEYIQEHKLWDWVQIPGKQKREKDLYFDRVPLEVIHPYGEQDARATYRVGLHQVSSLKQQAASCPSTQKTPWDVMVNERKLTKTFFKMEQVGIRINRAYCEEAAQHEEARYHAAADEIGKLVGKPFVDSAKYLAPVLEQGGIKLPQTLKGNASADSDALRGLDHPVARLVLEYRDAFKRANTYFRSFLYLADKNDVIHPNLRQGGTGTGRISVSDPNLQNVHKRKESGGGLYPVRRAFVPRAGFLFGDFDYDQMEYRMMMDYAGEMELIAQVLGGLDVHQATALLMSVEREPAKTINFLLLYGGGDAKLAAALGIPLERAKSLKALYFEKLPKVQQFIRRVIRTAEQRKFIFNWAGRRMHFPNSTFAYKAPNYLIQGGSADVVKIAMNRLDDLLESRRSRMLLQVHDELLFEIHETEAELFPQIREIMESAYPHKHLPLTCGVDHCRESWFDKLEGAPVGAV